MKLQYAIIGNKKGALLKLKHKKLYEKEGLKLESTIIQMEQQMLSLESMYTNQEIVNVMQDGLLLFVVFNLNYAQVLERNKG